MPEPSDGFPPICDYEGSDYQRRFWEQGGREYEDRVEEIAIKRLLPKSGKILLELGAGAGRNTARYWGYERVVLLDYSLSQLQQAQNRLGKSERYLYVAADIYRLPFVKGLFDGATMIRTLHHMAEPARAISNVRAVLQPKGVFLLEFANKQNLKAILRFILRRQEWNPFSLEPVEFAPLNYDFHPDQVRRWLRESSFCIERQLTVSHFRIRFLKRLVPVRLLVAMDAIAQWSGDWWQLTPSVFVKASAVGDSPVAANGEFFQCPNCGSPIPEWSEDTTVECPGCKSPWGRPGGIYDFRKPASRSSAG